MIGASGAGRALSGAPRPNQHRARGPRWPL